jgi:hypothetical protein
VEGQHFGTLGAEFSQAFPVGLPNIGLPLYIDSEICAEPVSVTYSFFTRISVGLSLGYLLRRSDWIGLVWLAFFLAL